MGLRPTKALTNVYCQARLKAAEYNEKICSREGAAELLGVSVSTVSDWELGVSRPSCENIIKMADLYGAPELMNWYCTNECPIGAITTQELNVRSLDRLAIMILRSLNGLQSLSDDVLDIADGEIKPEQKAKTQHVINRLREIGKLGEELQLLLDRSQ